MSKMHNTDIVCMVTTDKGEFALVREDFEDIGISISLPDFLKDIAKENVKKMFLTMGQPKVVRNSTERKISFVMDAVDVNIPVDENEETGTLALFTAQHKAISRLTPGYKEYGVRSKKKDEHTIICMDYLSHALEDDLYNVLFLLVHKGKMVYGIFTCLSEEQVEMNMIFLACIESLRFAVD